jgi:hypothetical protein
MAMENKVTHLIRSLAAFEKVYLDERSKLIANCLGTTLPNCVSCGNPMFPRKQWYQLPVHIREQMKPIRSKGSQSRCTTCYRNAVRMGEVFPTKKPQKILSDEEIARLKRLAKGLPGHAKPH